jgi:hypothetical protein
MENLKAWHATHRRWAIRRIYVPGIAAVAVWTLVLWLATR